MKTILIDDEISALNLLTEYIVQVPQLELLQCCNNGNQAIDTINKLNPDLIFLDIQMPGRNGFEVIDELTVVPKIIFTTAYDEFALRAFEVNAIDYLLKPYTKQRFLRSIEKVFTKKENQYPQTINQLLQTTNPKKYLDRIFANFSNKLVNVNINDIVWIEADGDYTRIHTIDQFFISDYSMSDLERRLDPAKFVRVHRSAIVSIEFIREINSVNSFENITMRNGVEIRISRTYSKMLRAVLLSPKI